MTHNNALPPRPEYPRPQLHRDQWMNLNGLWEFAFDPGDSGWERGLVDADHLDMHILVPFAPESSASGINDTDFHEAVWYRRSVAIPQEWNGKNLLLHVGAVDHDSTVWVNGVEVGRHRGGFTSFSFDITEAAAMRNPMTITVRARDSKNAWQARGKQATWYRNSDCQYTRTTGIWQTVWIEPVFPTHIQRIDITPDLDNGNFELQIPIAQWHRGLRLSCTLIDETGTTVAHTETEMRNNSTGSASLHLTQENLHLWNPGKPYLYTLRITLSQHDGTVLDSIDSYAGMRSIAIEGNAVLVNGSPVFQRLVLDQGYWPETLMTAPDDHALEQDIVLSMQAGFNGARLHQKVFEGRYLYHADRLGYLVWAEFGDWGVSSGIGPKGNNQHPTASFITQWIEAVSRDYSHPCIIGWCPLNETYQLLTDDITVLDDVTAGMFTATKAIDSTRPVIDASGYSHRVADTDIYDAHSYEQDPAKFRDLVSGNEFPFINTLDNGDIMSVSYNGQPYFISEFGGIWWNPDLARENSRVNDNAQSWGYGSRVRSEAEFYQRFEGLIDVLSEDQRMFGYCYTQLTDVFQEQNGLYAFDRTAKFDTVRLKAIQIDAAARHRRIIM